ncbi:GlsB/YeaQ/YmgE family stress response membrane protein [Chitinivorax sp. B]|uniref:GlsB/YeaQ/YmgE family stress response membrane protein n=1 Tax=Chitinivorax sp. B TaxID=2502235 RepID=UPI0010FA0573|nr:GlsB/YeaQ/YmgE family stress response membrane protein [Chitinivorax sp. B]
MSLIAWIILGLLAGFAASQLVKSTGQGVVLDVLLGIAGAIIGGSLFNTFGMMGVTGFNFSLLVAIVSAALLLLVYHAVMATTRNFTKE